VAREESRELIKYKVKFWNFLLKIVGEGFRVLIKYIIKKKLLKVIREEFRVPNK